MFVHIYAGNGESMRFQMLDVGWLSEFGRLHFLLSVVYCAIFINDEQKQASKHSSLVQNQTQAQTASSMKHQGINRGM